MGSESGAFETVPEARSHASPEAIADRERRNRIVGAARDFLVNMGSLVRQLAVHAPTNEAVRSMLANVQHSAETLKGEGEDIAMVFAEGHTFVNGVWVRASRRMWDYALMMTDGLRKMRSRGFTLDNASGSPSLLDFAQVLRNSLSERSGQALGPDDVRLPGLRLMPISTADDARKGRKNAREAAFQVLREGVATLNRDEIVRLDLYMRRRQRALIQRLVQLAEESPEELLAMTTIRDPTLPPGAHSLLVAIYSIAIGRILDLSRADLLRLGIAAITHNLGESLVAPEIFSTPRALEQNERASVEQHPLLGARYVLRHYGLDAGMVERAIISAEHHQSWDGASGYPIRNTIPVHIFSQIVAVSDTFAALSGFRPHRPPFPPDQAVKLVLRRAETHLDPVLIRALIRLVGRYPPGSYVELDTGEMGIILGPGRGMYPLQRPRVLIISDPDGFEMPRFAVADLGERHPRRRAWLRTIVTTRNPTTLGQPISAYLFGEREELPIGRMDIDEMQPQQAQAGEAPGPGGDGGGSPRMSGQLAPQPMTRAPGLSQAGEGVVGTAGRIVGPGTRSSGQSSSTSQIGGAGARGSGQNPATSQLGGAGPRTSGAVPAAGTVRGPGGRG